MFINFIRDLKNLMLIKLILIYFMQKNIARDGGRTHAHIRELDLKSNALTTRPPGLLLI